MVEQENPTSEAPVNSFLGLGEAQDRNHGSSRTPLSAVWKSWWKASIGKTGKPEQKVIPWCLRTQVKLPGPLFPLEVLVLHLSRSPDDTSPTCRSASAAQDINIEDGCWDPVAG